MLINLEPFGRLGNRLFLGTHVLAFGLKHGIPTMNLGFANYADLFPWMDGNAALAYPWRETGDLDKVKATTLWHRFREQLPWSNRFRYWESENFDFDHTENSQLLDPLRKGQDVYLRAWLFRGFDSVRRYRTEILEVFRPRPEVASEVETFVSSVRSGVERLIGVHVRWEDYRGTEHYLDQEAFRSRMEAAAALWSDQKVRFVLFSNEKVPASGWGSLDVVLSPAPSLMFDLEAMGACDNLMAPPSTFSGWASFSGAVPLLTLKQAQPAITLDDFRVVNG